MSIEETPFLRWKDPYAWTENRQKFEKAIAKEDRRFQEAVNAATKATATASSMTQAFAIASIDHSIDLLWTYPLENPVILFRPNLEGGGGYSWSWAAAAGTPLWQDVGDLDIEFGATGVPFVAYTKENGTGTQDYRVSIVTPHAHLWTHKHFGGPDVAMYNGRVFFLESDSPLRYSRLVSLDLGTGKDKRVLLDEEDATWTLRLVRGEGECLFLFKERGTEQKCFAVEASRLIPVAPTAAAIVPSGRKGCLIRLNSLDTPWTIEGPANFRLGPALEMDGIELAALGRALLITREFGIRKFWKLSTDRPPILIHETVGTVLINPLEFWKGHGSTLALWLTIPGRTIECHLFDGKGMTPQLEPRIYGDFDTGQAVSSDGVPVRWILCRNRTKARGLVVCSYGAYGLPTSLNTARWKPWLDAGWAIGFALVRGGGDGNEIWADLGRLEGRERAIDDLEAVCLELQQITGCGPERTCVYGRSAGGLMVGGIAGRHSAGGLAGLIYAEAPYVDFLKTASHPELPLTPSEYNDFGNPLRSPAEFEMVLRSSPIHRLGPEGAPGIAVVCRSGTYDKQVFPYEPLKWILALRGTDSNTYDERLDNKYLAVSKTAGHFTIGFERYRDLMEDFVLINSLSNRYI